MVLIDRDYDDEGRNNYCDDSCDDEDINDLL